MYKYLFLLLSVIIVASCTTSPDSPKASLTGNVSLSNSNDHSGVTVALYNLAKLDTTIVRINNEYPHIGVIISQETEFDHRLQKPVAYTQTDIYGNFKLKDVKPGTYNVAFLKEGWSLKYIYNVVLSEGENVLSDPSQSNSPLINPPFSVVSVLSVVNENTHSQFTTHNSQFTNTPSSVVSVLSVVNDSSIQNSKLDKVPSVVNKNTHSQFTTHNSQFTNTPSSVVSVLSVVNNSSNSILLLPSVTMPPVITSPITFESGVQYNFPDDTIITAPITVESGSRLCIAPLKKVECYNTFTVNTKTTDYWNLTSSYYINSINPTAKIDSTQYFERMNVNTDSEVYIKQGIFKFLRSGLKLQTPKSTIENCEYDYNLNALTIQGGDIEISESLHKNSRDRSFYAINNTTSQYNKLNYNKNVSQNNQISIDLYEFNSIINNNFFLNNFDNIKLWNKTHDIYNNLFYKNNNCIVIYGGFANVSFNHFDTNKYYDLIFTEAYTIKSNGIIYKNNFYEFNCFILFMKTWNSLYSVASDINATNNYFVNEHINNQIYDKYDNPQLLYEFIYEPRSLNPITNAGIQ